MIDLQAPELPAEPLVWEHALCLFCGEWFLPGPAFDWWPVRAGVCPKDFCQWESRVCGAEKVRMLAEVVRAWC